MCERSNPANKLQSGRLNALHVVKLSYRYGYNQTTSRTKITWCFCGVHKRNLEIAYMINLVPLLIHAFCRIWRNFSVIQFRCQGCCVIEL